MIRVWQRVSRLKTLDTQSLHYSEWTRKLGSFDLMGFSNTILINRFIHAASVSEVVCYPKRFFLYFSAISIGLPLGIFVTLPFCAKYISGPSTLLSVILSFIVAIMTGKTCEGEVISSLVTMHMKHDYSNPENSYSTFLQGSIMSK